MKGRTRTFTDEERKQRKADYQRRYRKTKMGRAINILQRYKQSDAETGRGECTLTAQWIVENIFTKPCSHCGKTGWNIIGCNRLDNSKPHTPDNVEPCCKECNIVEEVNDLSRRVDQINATTGEVVKTWNSTSECDKNGYDCGCISKCCNGIRNLYRGYYWRYVSN